MNTPALCSFWGFCAQFMAGHPEALYVSAPPSPQPSPVKGEGVSTARHTETLHVSAPPSPRPSPVKGEGVSTARHTETLHVSAPPSPRPSACAARPQGRGRFKALCGSAPPSACAARRRERGAYSGHTETSRVSAPPSPQPSPVKGEGVSTVGHLITPSPLVGEGWGNA